MEKTKNALRFVLFTYMVTWLLWLPAIVQSLSGKEISQMNFVIGVFGLMVPSVMGLIFLLKESKLKDVLRDLFKFSMNKWMAVVFVLLPLVMVIAHATNVLIFGASWPVIEEAYKIPLQFVSVLVLGGPLIEEIGWRGYLQNKLNQRYSPIAAGLIVGVIWAIWHFPLFLIKEMLHGGMPLSQFTITVILMSMVISVFQAKANSGIWPALIFHTYMNVTMDVTPLFNEKGHTLWAIVNGVLLVVVIGIGILYDKKKQLPDASS